MDLFEQYQKDWKQGKANQDSNPLSNLKNKEIMDQLIRYEQEEHKQIKKGAVGGAVGILIGLGGAFTGLVLSGTPITTYTVLGVVLMIFGLVFAVYNMLQKEPLQASNQNTKLYLNQAKEILIARRLKIKKYYTLYIIILMIGMGMVTSMLPYFVVGAIFIAAVMYYYWDVRDDITLKLQLDLLDEKIANLK